MTEHREGTTKVRRLIALAAVMLMTLLNTSIALAGPPYQGTTELLAAPLAGTVMDVEVSVSSEAPVVPFEYAIQNECQLPAKGGASFQRDDIVYWTFEDDGIPHAVMPIDLGSIPVGANCEVFLVRSHTMVKGSKTAYTVQ